MNAEWRAVLTEAFVEPHRELGVEMPLDALVSLVMTFNIGIIVERLGGIESGTPGAARVDRRVPGEATMTVELQAPASEQTRALYPDRSGHVERDGVNLYYEVYGSGDPRCCSSRRGRSSTRGIGRCRFRTSPGIAAVVTFDGRGSGRRTARPADTRSASSPPTPSR